MFFALMKLASPLACVGVFDFTFWFFFLSIYPANMYFFVFICLVSLLSLAGCALDRYPLIAKFDSEALQTTIPTSNLHAVSLSPETACASSAGSFHQMMRFVYISLSMSVPEVPYARFSVQPSYFLFPLTDIATPRRCITAATRLAVACPLAALHR